MSFSTIRARLRRLEQARQAADTRRPDPHEMRDAVLTGQGRPIVMEMIERFRAFAVEIEDATHGFCPLPEPRP